MAYTARSRRTRRTTAVLAVLSLGIITLTACKGDAEADASGPGTAASPSASDGGKDADKPDKPSTAGQGGDDGGSGDASGGSDSTPAPSEPGADDDQDGGVGMCETTDLTYKVTVASKLVNHALLAATNNSGDPCLLPANDLVITIPGLDGAAEHMGPEGKDWIMKAGETAYAGILFSRADTAGGKSADKVEVALTASESPATVTIADGPVTVNDGQVTSFFGTAEDALTY
ncbi:MULTISPECIES: DUF4232 domain-containing protein [Streptomyces]|uniref:DUF4232 domain-containing protein n=1 Tax=Streptomyces TaxID=1883 RepID=UPI000BDBA8D8|nr:DUF4232 domain-containing protein [Streptomyces sp. 1222.2]SOD66231.1 Protein of unknown function [Streptomyces sp. 1222.2]